MANLKQFQGKTTVDLIYEYHKKRGDSQPPRGYLGASIIGHECERYLWYCFRQACLPNFSGRMHRLFETGDLAEARFTEELRAIGCIRLRALGTLGEMAKDPATKIYFLDGNSPSPLPLMHLGETNNELRK